MKMFLAMLLGLIASSMSDAHAADNAGPDVARIDSVIEAAFRTAIIDKDQDRFLALFLPGTRLQLSSRCAGNQSRTGIVAPGAYRLRLEDSFGDLVGEYVARTERQVTGHRA